MTTHVSTVKHIPRACRSAFSEVLAQELRWANSGSIWGAIRLFLLAKCILHPPSRGECRRFHATASLINNRIHQWQNGEIESLWLEASESIFSHTSRLSDSKSSNSRRCLQLAWEGQYSKAIRALDSKGVAAPGDPSALQDLSGKHPSSPVVPSPVQVQHSMSVDTNKVLLSIQNFPRLSSPGLSQLRARHLFDTICGSTSSSAHVCLTELTHWLNLLLAGKAHLERQQQLLTYRCWGCF